MADISKESNVGKEQPTDVTNDGDLPAEITDGEAPDTPQETIPTEVNVIDDRAPPDTNLVSDDSQISQNIEKEGPDTSDLPTDETSPEKPSADVIGELGPIEDANAKSSQVFEDIEEDPSFTADEQIDGTVTEEPTSPTVELIEDPLQSSGYAIVNTESTIESNAPPVLLKNRYDVFPSNRLPELDSPSAKAFEAKDQKRPQFEMFALVCFPQLPVRTDEIEQIVRQRIPSVLGLLDYGVIDWPILDKNTVALIYERPLGGRVNDVIAQETSEYQKIDYIRSSVDAIIEGIGHLSTRGITHRALRYDNLFFLDEKRERVVLGDFVSSPAGFDQPVVYETIEKCMADEGGRGIGLPEDDMYAFGVTLAFMVQKQLPVLGYSKEKLILAKIETASYRTLVGKNLITATMLEPMRGLLNDNPTERWGMEQLENWKSGLPNLPNPAVPPERAHRPMPLGGYDHLYPRGLAYSMAHRPEVAIELIKDGTIERWIKKDLMDEELSVRFDESAEITKFQSGKVKGGDALLLAHVLILLDPKAPVRYKGVSYMPDAFGTALVTEQIRGGDPKILAESIVYKIPDFWVAANEEDSISTRIEQMNYARIRTHLQMAGPGYGVERCMYELNHDFPCQSPLFEKDYILFVEDILPSLDEAEKRVNPKTNPVDRHIAAFVAVKVKQSIDKFLHDIADPDDALKILGSLKLLAFLQNLYGPETLLGLSKWIGGQMGPVIKLYQSRSTRKILETEEPRIVRNGKLDELLTLLDAPDAREKDEEGYEQAIEKFRTAQEKTEQIEHDIGPNSDKAHEASRQVAAVTSGVIMTFAIVIMVIAG